MGRQASEWAVVVVGGVKIEASRGSGSNNGTGLEKGKKVEFGGGRNRSLGLGGGRNLKFIFLFFNDDRERGSLRKYG